MKAFKHVGNTWLASHLIHLVIICFIYFSNAGLIIPLFVGTLIISLPSLALSLSLVSLLPFKKCSVAVNLGIWLMLVSISIGINLLLIAGLFGELSLLTTESEIYMPSLIATILAILIRYWQFNDFIIHQKKQYENQNDFTSTY
jgi:hypothetical protein